MLKYIFLLFLYSGFIQYMKCGFRNDICIRASHALYPLPCYVPHCSFPSSQMASLPLPCHTYTHFNLDSAYEKRIVAYFTWYDGLHCRPPSSWWQPASPLPISEHRGCLHTGCCAQHGMWAPLLSAYLDPRSYKTRSGTAGPWCTSNLSLLSNFPTDVHGGCTNHLQPHQQFPSTSPAPHILISVCFLDDAHSDWDKTESQYNFDLHSFGGSMWWIILRVFIWPFVLLLRTFCPVYSHLLDYFL